jgi:hypothetical protein
MTTFNADELNDENPSSVSERAASGRRDNNYDHVTPPLKYKQLEDPPIDVIVPEENDYLEGDGDDEIKAKIAEAAEQDVEPVKPETDAVPGTTIALADRLDVSTLGENWQHDWLDFKGDKLGIRLPTRQALAAFSLASSKYVDMMVKNDLTGLFIARHLSPESYGRVFSRLMDPDENDYTVDTVGELFNAIVTAAVKSDEKPSK